MNNKQIAHLWANKSRESARGSHFFFEGDTIYSYGTHFPIARHYKGAVLFTSNGYSVTTSKHKGYVAGACSHLTTFTIANVMRDPCAADLKDYREQINELALSAARARDPKWKLEALQRAVDEANDFCLRFGFSTKFEMPSDLEAIKLRAKEETAKKAKATARAKVKFERDCKLIVGKWIAGETGISIPSGYSKVHLRALPGVIMSPGMKSNGLPSRKAGRSSPIIKAQ